MNYYNFSPQETLKKLKTSPSGLSQNEAKKRLAESGLNEIKVAGKPLWKKIIEPITDVFMLVLIFAGVISIFHGDTLDAIIIFAIVVVNAGISYVQEYSTEKILRELRKTSEQIVEVVRGGKTLKISKSDLVAGDIVQLSEGDKIPADGRILSANSVRVDESMLTGESLPITKTAESIEHKNLEAYQQTNMLFQGAFVISGNLQMAVTATGSNTEFGKLAELSSQISSESPVQAKINKLVRKIIFFAIGLAIVAFGLSLWRGTEFVEAVKFVLTMSVSFVPEGLPIAISIILALGMRKMAREKALVRNLRAIETVGVITTIATDKTGTLTENRLTLQKFHSLKPEDEFYHTIFEAKNNSEKTRDPLDIALDDFIKMSGKTFSAHEPLRAFGFNQDLAMSGNLSHAGEKFVLSAKGAPEKMMALAKISAKQKKEIQQKLEEYTGEGFRVLAIVRTELSKEIEKLEEIPANAKFEFVGLIAVADVLRSTSAKAIREARAAGVSVRMITGDHPETAFHIGEKLGLADSRDQIFDASAIDNLSDKELEKAVSKARVFARITPESKFKILKILEKTEITAMTGDGVNDVPALAGANVGFAMGSGSEIAKDASDIVLLDDNFKSIITAMKEGRIIVSNISKMLFYALSTNAGEAATMIGALILGIPLPLVPVQILWINLVTDSTLIIPLGLEPANGEIMKRKPSAPNSPILSKTHIARMAWVAILMAAMAIFTYTYYARTLGVDAARTLTFTLLTVIQWANAINSRNLDKSIFAKNSHAFNGKFWVGMALAIGLQLVAIFTPLSEMLHVSPVPLGDMLFVSAIAFVSPIILVEIHKFFTNLTEKRFPSK